MISSVWELSGKMDAVSGMWCRFSKASERLKAGVNSQCTPKEMKMGRWQIVAKKWIEIGSNELILAFLRPGAVPGLRKHNLGWLST